MSLSDLAAIGSLVSGFAVTASLIYLAIQTHQSVKHTRALIHQGRVLNIQAFISAQLDPGVAELILLENGDETTPDAVRKYRFSRIATMQFVSWNDSYSQYQSGLLNDDDLVLTRRAVAKLLEKPGYHLAWDNWKVPGSKFAAFIDEIAATKLMKPIETR